MLGPGVPCTEPVYVFRDNHSALANMIAPTSMVKKKLNLIAYHFVHDGSA